MKPLILYYKYLYHNIKLEYTSLTIFFLLVLTVLSCFGEEKRFVIAITSYNNAPWYEKNLSSVFSQNYENYRVIYIDDCSTDGTPELVENFIKNNKQEHRTIVIKNETWQSQMANHYKLVHMCHDEEIIVHLDGDDWLIDQQVLSYLNEIYQDSSIWLTYGQCLMWPKNSIGPNKPIPAGAIEENDFRHKEWMYGHLRSFYAWLFKLIKLPDLMIGGSFIPLAPSPDVAFMFPMLEMAGAHVRFIDKVLYVWNRDNPLSQKSKKQLEVLGKIRWWPKYRPINEPILREYSYDTLTADVIIFSSSRQQNNPLIESFKNNNTSYKIITVSNKGTVKNIENILLGCGNYVLLCHEDCIFPEDFNFSQSIKFLESTYSFCLCYAEASIKKNHLPQLFHNSNLRVFQFTSIHHKELQPFSINMVLYRKSIIIDTLNFVKFSKSEKFITAWQACNRRKKLFFKKLGLVLQ